MVLPLLLGMLGGSLGTAGALGGLGALGGAAIGSGLGGYIQTGDLETGIMTGLGAFAGGSLFNALGGAAGAAAPTAANAAQASAAGLPTAAAIPPPIRPTDLMATSAAASAAPASTGIMGIGKGAMDFAKSGMGMATGVGASAGSALGPMIGGTGDIKKKYSGDASKEMQPMPRSIQFPGQDYVPGTSPEFDYGFGPPPSAQGILDYRDRQINPYKMADGGMIRSLERTFGPIRLAAGGIASLVEQGDEAQVPPSAAVGGNEKDVVVEAVRAIKGESANPEIALGAFLAQYGEDALRDLVDKVQSGATDETIQRSEGKMQGAGDGMDDLIPATIDGEQDVLLSDGEFVVPADVVSGLGNGSSDAGARALDEMMNRVRTARNGAPEQPPKIPQKEVLPA